MRDAALMMVAFWFITLDASFLAVDELGPFNALGGNVSGYISNHCQGRPEGACGATDVDGDDTTEIDSGFARLSMAITFPSSDANLKFQFRLITSEANFRGGFFDDFAVWVLDSERNFLAELASVNVFDLATEPLPETINAPDGAEFMQRFSPVCTFSQPLPPAVLGMTGFFHVVIYDSGDGFIDSGAMIDDFEFAPPGGATGVCL